MYGGAGGGVLIASSTGKIKDITFKNNISAGDGAGIAISHSNIILDKILFVENNCHGYGAAIAAWQSNVILQNIQVLITLLLYREEGYIVLIAPILK